MDTRNLYSDSSLADLYDELKMPSELRKAHLQNNKAAIQVYGFTKVVESKRKWLSEDESVTELVKLYQEMTAV